MTTLFNVSLWGDEAFSALAAQKALGPMLQIVFRDTSPPLFYLISFFWFRLFGSSEIAIRTLSFLFYLATSVIIYFLGKYLFNRKTGLLASLLTFSNPFLFPYAFEGRMYFCLLFFVVLSFYCLVRSFRWGYILAATAALYSHHFAIFALAAQFLWQLSQTKERRAFLEVFKPYLIIALLYLPWLYPLYLQTSRVAGGFWLGRPTIHHLFGSIKNFFVANIPYQSGQKYAYLATLITLLLRRWQKEKRHYDLLFILWALTPLILTFLISQTKLSIFYERYLLYSVPPLMLLLASQRRRISLFLLGFILAVYLSSSWHQFTHPFKKPFREFASWIKTHTESDLPLVNYNGNAHHLWESKYYGLKAPIYSPRPLPFYVGTAQMTDQDIIRQLPQREFGLITSDDPKKIRFPSYQTQLIYQLDSLYFLRVKPKQ